MSKHYDVAIVGMGLAGIQFSYQSNQHSKSCIHFHQAQAGDSTPVAAGLINPITGRRYVKSWMIDEVMPYAIDRYQQLEELLDDSFLSTLDIIRVLKDAGDENTWLSKSADPYLAEFLCDEILEGQFHEGIRAEPMMGLLKGCYRVDIGKLQKLYLKKLREDHQLIEGVFDYQLLEIGEVLRYNNVTFDHIIFAEGWRVMDNPYFQVPAFSPAKGELLLIHAPALKLKKSYKKEQFITPLGEDIYWVGATYEWQNFNTEVTEKMRERIQSKLDEIIEVPYKIIAQLSGIRPSSVNRKPVIGSHPKYSNLHIFNGLGTKGTSLAPYFSEELFNHIYHGGDILKDINVLKYFNKLN